MRKINKIILHISDSEFGDVDTIRQWHLERGFDDIGYHYVIGNAYPNAELFKGRKPIAAHDGLLLPGRPVNIPGAHVKGHNRDSIGICLIGKNTVSGKQIETAVQLIGNLATVHKLTADDVFGHYEFDDQKSCPNINMEFFRTVVREYMT